MSKKIKALLTVFILGFMFGGLLGISIHYPITPKTMQAVEDTCKSKAFMNAKVGITGHLYEVTCANGLTYYLK